MKDSETAKQRLDAVIEVVEEIIQYNEQRKKIQQTIPKAYTKRVCLIGDIENDVAVRILKIAKGESDE